MEALKKRDFKTVIDLNLNDQREIAGIRAANPRALWPRLIDDYYRRRITSLTEASTFWGDYGRSTMAMMGDPTNNLRTILYFLPPSCKWTVSEVRSQNKLSIVYDRYHETTVYVTVDYPLDESTPLSGKYFLKQIMLEIPVYAGNQSIMNVYTVKGTEVIWQKPYPGAATPFLVSKYKAEVLNADRETIKNAINELIEIAGPEAGESYLLEVIDQESHKYPTFDLALDYLAERHVKKALPVILETLRDPNYSDKTDLYCPKHNLVRALERLGKTESSEEISVLKERLSDRIAITNAHEGRFECINAHLRALASVDNEAWRSFPFGEWPFEQILNHIQQDATLIDYKSPGAGTSTAFLASLTPCNRVYCPVTFARDHTIAVDPFTVEIRGRIMEPPREMQRAREIGKYKMILKRYSGEPDKWLVYEIRRVENASEDDNVLGANSSQPGVKDVLQIPTRFRLKDEGTNMGSTWLRIGPTTWVESFPDGRSQRFRVVERARVDGVQGTILRRNSDNLDIFVPDMNSGSVLVQFRVQGNSQWRRLREMVDVERK